MERKDETFPREVGIVPESKFPVRSRTCRAAIFSNCGIGPERAFHRRSTVTSLDDLNRLVGITPDKLLRERIISLSEELFDKESGITPLRELFARLTYRRDAAVPNDRGIIPASLLPASIRIWRF